MPKRGDKRLVDVLDGIDKMEVQYTKVLPKLHRLMNVIRSSVISNKENDYSFVEGMVTDIEKNKCVISKLDLNKCNRLYKVYKKPGTGYVRDRDDWDGLGIDEI